MPSWDDPTRTNAKPESSQRLLEPELDRRSSTRHDVELDAAASARVGQRFGRFEIRDVLGAGGMGTVFEARDGTLDRAVALKLLHPDVATGAERRVLREAKAMAKLSHPNVVQIYETGVVDDRPFIAMELVRGQTLTQWQATPHPWRECVAVYLQAGQGLAAAHARGLVHRDFKPSNCILDEDGRVRVVDFGLAQRIDSSVIEEARASRITADGLPGGGARPDPHTRDRGAFGTLGYMPLEQLWGQALDAKSDQFSFCVSLFEALHGHRPFRGASPDALAIAMIDGTIDWPPGAPRVPARLRKLLERGLRPEPVARWPAMDDVLHELELLHAGRSRRGRWWLGGLGLVIAGATVWSTMQGPPPCPDPRIELHEVWNPERRERVIAAIEGASTEVPLEVLPRLDAFAEGWVTRSEAACSAARDGLVDAGSAGPQQQCLAEARDALGELATLFGSGDDSGLRMASWWLGVLPDLDRCKDGASFVPFRPLPSDPEAVEQAHALRLQRAIAQSALLVRQYERALAVIEPALAEAQLLGFTPLVAELELVRGSVWVEQGRFDAAEVELERAYSHAVEHGHPRVALDAAITLTYVMGDLREHYDVGFKWGLTAEALARQPWSHPMQLASVMAIMGNVLYEQGRFEAALERYRQSLEVSERLEPDGFMESHTQANIGLVLHEQGRYEDALPLLYDVLVRCLTAPDTQPTALATALVSLGTTLRRLGRHDEALGYLLEALDLRERTLGPEHPEVVIVLNELGRLWLDTSELPRALGAHQQALALGSRSLEPSQSDLADAWLGLGRVLQAHGLLEGAARHVARAVKLLEQSVGPRHVRVGLALAVLGDIAREQGERAAAREHLELALDILARAEVPPGELAAARFALARVLWSSPAEQQTALALAEQARDAWALAGEPAREQTAEVKAWLAAHRTLSDP